MAYEGSEDCEGCVDDVYSVEDVCSVEDVYSVDDVEDVDDVYHAVDDVCVCVFEEGNREFVVQSPGC